MSSNAHRHLLRRLAAPICALLLTNQPTSAQQPAPGQPQPNSGQQPAVTFRTEVNFVEVHAIVTDERGGFVRGLTAEDFEIYEDGRLQKPAVFSLVDLPIERRFTPFNASEPVESDVRATTRTFEGRIYVLVLDEINTVFSRSPQVRNAAKQFIEQYLGPNDLAAVVYTSARGEAGQELTNNRRLLLAAIDRFQGRKIPSSASERMALHLKEHAVELAGQEDVKIRTNEELDRARSTRDPLEQERAYNARRTLEAIENVSKWLSDVQGRRKALLLFSEGIDYDIYQPFDRGGASSIISYARQTAAAAQRANVNVYSIDPRGLNELGGMVELSGNSDYPQLEFAPFPGAYRELLLTQESLITLADETGGLAVVRTNNIAEGLGRIVLDNSRYYLLGYYSDSARWSNKFLKLDVRVKKPGMRVRARRGFMPPNPRDAEKAREAEVKAGTSAALKAAMSKPVPVGDIPMRVTAASFKGTDENAAVLIALEMEGSGLKFEARDGRFAETIEVSILAADEKAKVQGSDHQTHKLNLVADTHARVTKDGVRFLSKLELPPARYQIRVGAHATTNGAVSTVPFDLEVPDYSKRPFSMSDMLLTSSEATAAIPTANPDPEFNTVLSGPPVATRRFAASDTLRAFVEVYEGPTTTKHSVNFVATVQNAADGKNMFSAREERVVEPGKQAQGQGFRTDIPLKTFGPGTYLLRTEATSGTNTVKREILFEVR